MAEKFVPKIESKRIDGVSYNVAHAKKLGKDAWVAEPQFVAHFPDVPDAERKKLLAAVYDQIVAPSPTPSSPASPVALQKS